MRLLFLFLFSPIICFSQLHIKFGLTVGKTLHHKVESNEYSIYSPGNDQLKNYYSKGSRYSPVLGLHTSLHYRFLYVFTGVEYNNINYYYNSFSEKGFFYGPTAEFIRYTATESSKEIVHKLNFPIEAGLQFFKDKLISPFVFAGVNINYIVGGKFEESSTTQDPFTREIKTMSNTIRILDKNDNYYTKNIIPKFQLGGGIYFKKYFAFKFSYRPGFFMSMNQLPSYDYNNGTQNCFVNYYRIIRDEYLFSLLFYF